MSSFYFAPTFKRVIGTSPYTLQVVSPDEESHVETAQPQIAAAIELQPEYHQRDDLPDLKINLNTVKARATQDILKDLDSRFAKKQK